MLIYNRPKGQGEKIMTIERKFKNGDVIICTKPNNYNFKRIEITRKAKSKKSDKDIMYHCNVEHANGSRTSWYITEKMLLNLKEGND